VLQNRNVTQHAVHLHPFSYDPTQGGTTFRDPDGDPLTYTIKIGHVWNPHDDPNPPAGLRAEGHFVVGAPEELATAIVTITASDGRSWPVHDQFWILVAPNSAPQVVDANADVLVAVGDSVDIEASGAGAVFADPDGDPLTYEVALRGVYGGLSVIGTRVTGVMNSIAAVEVIVTARDAYGGEGIDAFLVAAPAAQPGAPTLPNPSYVYRDAALDLPFRFQDSPFDTTRHGEPVSDDGATLGRVLFYDRRLSITNTHACSSCHIQSRGFASADRFPTGILGLPTKRHAMALANTRFNLQIAWFQDMRVRSLEELALMPIEDHLELGASVELAATRMRATPFYPPLFAAAFGTPEITGERIARALAQFLRSLISYRSKFDLAFNPPFNGPGDPASVLTAQEFRGFEIFDDNHGIQCTLCHEIHLGFNNWQANNGLDLEDEMTDLGTLDPVLQRDGSLGVFRPASLRNIEVSAPYMHDGRFATLRDVIDHYDHGIKDTQFLDRFLREVLSSGLPKRMNLTDEDKDALEAFLRTMTDHEFLADPKFSDPFD
jgi:cytochrome c peroxidase